jgi:hypothetical protein
MSAPTNIATPPQESQQLSKELEACQEAIKNGDMYEVLSLTSKGFDVSFPVTGPEKNQPRIECATMKKIHVCMPITD